MGFSTTDWVAIFVFRAGALVGTLGKRLVRIIGLAVMPFAFAGLIVSLGHHGSAPGQGPITNNAPSSNTKNPNDNAAEPYDLVTVLLRLERIGREIAGATPSQMMTQR